MEFHINQIVAGKVGYFVIRGFCKLPYEEELYAQVKCYNPETGEVARGDFTLPLSVLRPIE